MKQTEQTIRNPRPEGLVPSCHNEPTLCPCGGSVVIDSANSCRDCVQEENDRIFAGIVFDEGSEHSASSIVANADLETKEAP